MLIKTGVNNTRAEKSGPTVKKGVAAGSSFKKVIKCSSCGAKLEKSCSSEMVCEISSSDCPRCGCRVN